MPERPEQASSSRAKVPSSAIRDAGLRGTSRDQQTSTPSPGYQPGTTASSCSTRIPRQSGQPAGAREVLGRLTDLRYQLASTSPAGSCIGPNNGACRQRNQTMGRTSRTQAAGRLSPPQLRADDETITAERGQIGVLPGHVRSAGCLPSAEPESATCSDTEPFEHQPVRGRRTWSAPS